MRRHEEIFRFQTMAQYSVEVVRAFPVTVILGIKCCFYILFYFFRFFNRNRFIVCKIGNLFDRFARSACFLKIAINSFYFDVTFCFQVHVLNSESKLELSILSKQNRYLYPLGHPCERFGDHPLLLLKDCARKGKTSRYSRQTERQQKTATQTCEIDIQWDLVRRHSMNWNEWKWKMLKIILRSMRNMIEICRATTMTWTCESELMILRSMLTQWYEIYWVCATMIITVQEKWQMGSPSFVLSSSFSALVHIASSNFIFS